MILNPLKRRRTRENFTYERKKLLVREIENSSIHFVSGKYGIKVSTLYGFMKDKLRILKACEHGLGQKKALSKKHEPMTSDQSCKSQKKKIDLKPSFMEENEWSKIQGEYAESDISLATEFGMFFKTQINDCRSLRGEKCDLGDMADERFTILVCADLTGNDLKNLAVVGNFQKLPQQVVNYYYDDTAWMTSQIFEKELREWDDLLGKENRKIVLFTDEKSVHRTNDLKNIKLMFYTDLTPEKNLTFDMVRCMKVYYRRNLMEMLKKEPNFKLTPSKAILELRQVWKIVPSDAVRSSFVEAGIICGDQLDVYKSLIDTWSMEVSPDHSLLTLYSVFDEHLVTSAEFCDDESEEGDTEDESVRLITVQEAFEAARTLRDYCAQGSLDQDLRDQVLDVVAKVQERTRKFRSLDPEVVRNGSQNQGECHSRQAGESTQQHTSILANTLHRASMEGSISRREDGRAPQQEECRGSMEKHSTPGRQDREKSQQSRSAPTSIDGGQFSRHNERAQPRSNRGESSKQGQHRLEKSSLHKSGSQDNRGGAAGQSKSSLVIQSRSRNYQGAKNQGQGLRKAAQSNQQNLPRVVTGQLPRQGHRSATPYQRKTSKKENGPPARQIEGISQQHNQGRPSIGDQQPFVRQERANMQHQRRPSREGQQPPSQLNERHPQSDIGPARKRGNEETGLDRDAPSDMAKRPRASPTPSLFNQHGTDRMDSPSAALPRIAEETVSPNQSAPSVPSHNTPSNSSSHTSRLHQFPNVTILHSVQEGQNPSQSLDAPHKPTPTRVPPLIRNPAPAQNMMVSPQQHNSHGNSTNRPSAAFITATTTFQISEVVGVNVR